MSALKEKSLLVIYQPWKNFKGSLHEMLIDALKTLPVHVVFLEMEISEKFTNTYWPDKIRNIYERIVHKNNQYFLIAENKFYNRFFFRKLNELTKKKKKYDYILIIKPEEYSTKFIKKASSLGKITVGYIWDGLRLYLKPNLINSRPYLKYLYSFDTNNIATFPELNMEFCTNFFVPQTHLIPYETRDIDLYYIGDVGGGLKNQRRDLKLNHFLGNIKAKADIKLLNLLNLPDHEKVNHPMIEYIQQPVSMQETFEKVKNSKVVIDICKSHHIGLSFRFFECLAAETKIITNNQDVRNYDFYHPENIMIVDFDFDQLQQDVLDDFLNKPYQSIDETILNSYSIDNWFKYLFKIDGFLTIQKK